MQQPAAASSQDTGGSRPAVLDPDRFSSLLENSVDFVSVLVDTAPVWGFGRLLWERGGVDFKY